MPPPPLRIFRPYYDSVKITAIETDSDGKTAQDLASGEIKALLEAPDLKTRAEILIAVTEMDLAKKQTTGDPPLQ